MPLALWTSPAFLDEATAWAAGHAARHDITLTGEREQPHARPWSSAVRLGSDAGPLWFKVNGPGTRHEPLLTGLLGSLVPDLVPDLLAADADRGWSLLRDAGPTLRSTAPPDALWEEWATLLPRYGEAQLVLAAHREALLRTELRDLSPTALPTAAREVLGTLAALPAREGGLDPDQHRRLEGLLPAYDGWCAELAAGGIPASVNHDDLHSANICWVPGRAVPERVLDWGDASVTHPFGTLLGTLNSISHHAGTGLDDPRVVRVRDAYLEPFGAFGDRAELVRWVALARRTGPVTRALSYLAAFLGEPADASEADGFPARAWLLSMLDDED